MESAGKNVDQIATTQRSPGPRHSILDLAPLELECMSALWPLGEGTVRDIHRQLARSRPRAYTTIMTIMDRLAHKGIVRRRRVGRAYRYEPNLSVKEARVSAIEKIVTGFFDGSADALVAHLAESTRLVAHQAHREPSSPPELPSRLPIDRTDTSDEESETRQLDKPLL